MPTLEWIGKDKVINHHQEVPYRLLDEKYTCNAETSENKIIHGDNLLFHRIDRERQNRYNRNERRLIS